MRERLAPYKRVRIEFCELPKTISDKIRRVELRRREPARDSDARGETEFREEDFPELAGRRVAYSRKDRSEEPKR